LSGTRLTAVGLLPIAVFEDDLGRPLDEKTLSSVVDEFTIKINERSEFSSSVRPLTVSVNFPRSERLNRFGIARHGGTGRLGAVLGDVLIISHYLPNCAVGFRGF
jgi:hypothetical protein